MPYNSFQLCKNYYFVHLVNKVVFIDPSVIRLDCPGSKTMDPDRRGVYDIPLILDGLHDASCAMSVSGAEVVQLLDFLDHVCLKCSYVRIIPNLGNTKTLTKPFHTLESE